MGLAIPTSYAASETSSLSIEVDDFTAFAENLYAALTDTDLDYEPFEKALKGYLKLQKEGKIEENSYLTVIDMSISANRNRFFFNRC